jgi:putative Mg2+ transporter-C (MgtC) family protein
MWTGELALFGRIALGMLLGYVIGWEREVRGHAAGSRTFALVCGGSSALTVIGLDAFPIAPERLIAGVVSGIGFIGAGVVLKDTGGKIRGLTTAAAIWSTAAIGIMVGSARFVLGTLTTALVLLVLEGHTLPGLKVIDARRWAHHFAQDQGSEEKQDSQGQSG